VAQRLADTQRAYVLDLVIVVNGRRLPISQKYNDLGQLAKSTDNTWWAKRLSDSAGGDTPIRKLSEIPSFF